MARLSFSTTDEIEKTLRSLEEGACRLEGRPFSLSSMIDRVVRAGIPQLRQRATERTGTPEMFLVRMVAEDLRYRDGNLVHLDSSVLRGDKVRIVAETSGFTEYRVIDLRYELFHGQGSPHIHTLNSEGHTSCISRAHAEALNRWDAPLSPERAVEAVRLEFTPIKRHDGTIEATVSLEEGMATFSLHLVVVPGTKAVGRLT